MNLQAAHSYINRGYVKRDVRLDNVLMDGEHWSDISG